VINARFPHSYGSVLSTLAERLKEVAPGRVQVLTGPRQVGKTHLLRALERRWRGRAVYAAADEPAASLPGWWEARWQEAEHVASRRGSAVLLIDEIHFLPEWSRRLKTAYDRLTHEKVPIHVVVSGSSSLRVGRGARETMAGRFESLRLLHWPARELARQLKIEPDRAVEIAARFGTYPGAVALLDDETRWASYVRDAIVEPAVGRDIMAMEVIRKPALLRQVFALAVGHPAEIVSLQKLQGALGEAGALETIAHYLAVLEQAFLVAPIEKFSPHAVRRRAAPPKLVVLNQGILAALSVREASRPEGAAARWGRWVENACIAHAWNAGQAVSYWRQEPLEVDMVTSGSWGAWAVEVTTAPYSTRDLAGLLGFCAANPAYRPLLVCEAGREALARRQGTASISWQEFLLSGPPT
jgi:uncharacterized protein